MKRICTILAVFALALCQGVVSSAQDTREYEKKKARLEADIAMLDRQLSENASKSRSELSRLTLVRAKISGRKDMIRASDRQIRKYSDNIYLTQKQINRLDARLDTLSDYYGKLIRNAYKNRDGRVWYMYILASDDLGQAFRRYSYFKNLSVQTKVQADKIRATREELEDRKDTLRRLKAEAEEVRDAREKELESLRQEEEAAEVIIAQLRKNKSKYEKELAAKKKQVQALEKEIKRIIDDASRYKALCRSSPISSYTSNASVCQS